MIFFSTVSHKMYFSCLFFISRIFVFTHEKKTSFFLGFFSHKIVLILFYFLDFHDFKTFSWKIFLSLKAWKFWGKKHQLEKGLSCLNNNFFILIFRKTLFLHVWIWTEIEWKNNGKNNKIPLFLHVFEKKIMREKNKKFVPFHTYFSPEIVFCICFHWLKNYLET